ncbi:polyprenyl synthetase solanesyl diphosphate synthase [uncultured Dialister sp.]|uniref:polyprenyl synthetase solanesyl diphosphate synthase n=1 Tax=uncultured Dialister sp. TaxID=278064 RepID=UPI002597D2AC|nr:polyprenyl synthetase solanesyl diphosphate synthase [uncultured Dialister sp.]
MSIAEFNGKRLLNRAELCAYIGMGHSRAEAWAKQNGACKHIGRRVLYDRVIIDRVLDAMPPETSRQA